MPRSKSTIRLILEPIALAIVLALLVRTAFRLYAIPSASMAPTLEVGDHIIVTPYGSNRPDHGDVVVFRSPTTSEEFIVKRVIAVPGDLIEARNGRVLIGGHALAEPYLREAAASGAIQAQIIPADCYFVMGDNRGNSWDSRNWGVLPRELVVGRARLVLWSSGDGSSQPNAQATTVSPRFSSAAPIRLDRFFKSIR